ncbi:MAG: hypothetical protein HY883_00735 [Deltaproteobacteria bacterium]|nr:hypothetical protein [Deltaproteobacteria bacterium]
MAEEKRKPWSGRFKGAPHALATEFNASISLDWRLFRHDIRGSIAHAKALERAGILKKGERAKILKGLRSVEKEIASGGFRFTPDMEDIHMAIEKRLT